MSLHDQYLAVAKFPNGSQVAKRMVQMWACALNPENEYLVPSIKSVISAIAANEALLLERTQQDIVEKGSVLPKLFEEMRTSTDTEWGVLVDEVKPPLFSSAESGRLFADASGLTRNTKFRDWVLGQIENPIDVETYRDKARLLSKKERS